MSLAIRKLTTSCLTPPQHAALRSRVDQIARDSLRHSLGDHLGPGLDRLPEVVRVRRLGLHLEIRASQLNDTALSQLWSQAFSKALFEALAYPDGMGPVQTRRYDTRASYLAAALGEFSSRGSFHGWEYSDVARRYGSPAELFAAVASDEPGLIAPLLVELWEVQALDAVLSELDEFTLEKTFQALARNAVPAQPILQFLLVVAEACVNGKRMHGASFSFSSRRYALKIWTELARRTPIARPRAVWTALRTLRALIENPHWLYENVPADIAAVTAAADAGLPESVRACLLSVADSLAQNEQTR